MYNLIMPDEKTGNALIAETNEIQTSVGIFRFPYHKDPRYLTSPKREAIDKLNLRELFESEAKKVVKDLGITQSLEIVVEISSDVIENLGIAGRTSSEKEVVFQLDPSNSHVLESLVKWQKRQIAHEFNHLARWEMQEALLDALIFEGLAVNYEENWGGEYQETPWGHVLEPDQLKDEWQKAQKELNSPYYDYEGWFFGTNKTHPGWTGYTLGTAIVKKYLELHPDEPMKEIVKKPSQEILEQSKFA